MSIGNESQGAGEAEPEESHRDYSHHYSKKGWPPAATP